MGFKTLGLVISYINRFLFSTWLPCSAKIGTNFKIGYWGLAVVIHSDTIIGNNCLISQGVTIGKKKSTDKTPPILGDNVYIGANAVLIGEITIGDNVTIGANSFVNKSIPNNVVAAGNPFKIISKTHSSTIQK